MVIEWLVFAVAQTDQDRFIAADDAVWTPALAAQPGFLGKAVWRDVAEPDRLSLIIRWDSRDAWHAVPQRVLAETDARFRDLLGVEASLLSSRDLEVVAGE